MFSRKQKSYEAAKKKKAEQEQMQKLSEKRRQSEEKYRVWLANKSLTNDKQSSNKTCTKTKSVFQPQLTAEQSESNRRAWEAKKLVDDKRRREEIVYQKKQKDKQQEQRKKQAQESWEKWIADVGKKPKPVPLNRGLFSLKGTISDLYVNPNQWQNPNVDYD